MRISTNRRSLLEERSETPDRGHLTSQVSAIARLEVGNENIAASGSHLAGSQMSSALVAFTEDQIRLRADTSPLQEEPPAL